MFRHFNVVRLKKNMSYMGCFFPPRNAYILIQTKGPSVLSSCSTISFVWMDLLNGMVLAHVFQVTPA